MAEDSRSRHPECGRDLDAQGEFALARAFIISGDPEHGVKHLAFGLNHDPADPEGMAIIETLVTMHGPDAATLISQQGPVWSGDAAVLALIMHALGRDEEAVGLLLQLVVAEPAKRRSAWLRTWVSNPPLPLAPEALARTMLDVVQPDLSIAPDDPRIPTFVDLTEIASVLVGRTESPTMLFTLAAMVARRANLNAQALAFATEAWNREPTADHLCLVGYAHRELGDLHKGLAAFIEASSIDPGSVAARLDTAETLAGMGHFLDAALWATSVLDVDPNHDSAASRAAYYRARASDS